MDEIKFSSSIEDRPKWIKALLYGQAGVGKTRFCADAPNPFWFDFESSTETLRHWPDYRHIQVKKPDDVEEMKRDVHKLITSSECDTIVIDSLTTALDFYLRQHMEKQKSKRDQYVLYEADYKYATQVFSQLFGFLSDAPIHVIVIGHARVIRDVESGNITAIFPDATPRIRESLQRLVNVVGYLDAEPSQQKGTIRKLYLNRTKVIEAKNRLNIQETFVTNPVWKEIF